MVSQKVNSKEIADIFKRAEKVAIFGHILPDGDCYGSVFALKIALENMGKKVFSYISDEIPDYLSFLKNYENYIENGNFHSADVVLILDTSDIKRMENYGFIYKYREEKTPICLIDHHTEGDLVSFCDYVWQDTTQSSASEMALEVLRDMGIDIKKDIATLLLTGIETDTSSFQNQNTTGDTLKSASFLVSKGGRLGQIVKNVLHARDMDTIKLYGLVLERLVFNSQYKTITGYLSQEDVKKLGIKGDFSTGIANYLNTIEDAKMIVFITENEEGGLKVSLRTRDEKVDVSTLAKALGGGGHAKASGITIKGKILKENGLLQIV